MNVEITYLTWDSPDVVRVSLAAEEYFDPLEPGETFQTHGIPRYNHTWQYLDVPRPSLKWTTESRKGTGDDTTIRTQYLNRGQSWMTHRLDPDGYEEIIHVTQLSETDCHIIRTSRRHCSAWVVTLSSVIRDLPDGSQEEFRYDQPWTSEEITKLGKSFLKEEP